MFNKCEALILRTQDYGETHKIVTLFTKDIGKVGVIARGAKKPKSRMAAITQPFIHGEFLIQVGSGLGTMQQGEVIHSLRPIREDIIKTAYASYLAELTDKMVDQKQPDTYLYQQLMEILLAIGEGKDPVILTIIYEFKMFQKAGFAPTVHQCVNCGQTSDAYVFSVSEGGFLDSRCAHLDEHAIGIPPKLVKIIQLLSRVDVTRIGNISIKEENKRLLQRIMEAYYDQHGGYYLKSRKFLKQLDLLQ
ncbi:DNA repair protein RecO [Radiobacillus kanasensis]|uniref:DNA repair protein RecO n=1 Tax=Radiobacillus kanasensis TaxID=2844358 RepID=UPI001E4481CF|nr:DNA repair protein RecO [Radiobacillus kanasensis]UFT97809.1 DNA repair protein RecO [Radiobacillus kanasensis]